MIDWDGLRFVLAVARAGSALRAAKTLKVNQTTVTRRIAQIECEIGASLFESRQSGQLPTPLGHVVVAVAERVEAEILALKSTIDARRRQLSGSVRFTSSEGYANYVVAPFLRSFRQQFPGVTVELITNDRRLDIARGEADVALRASSRPEGGGIVAQRLPDASWTAYCARSYQEERGTPTHEDGFDGHAILLVEGQIAQLPSFRWLGEAAARAGGVTRSNSITNLISATKAGLGITMFPCFIGDSEPELVRCMAPPPSLDGEVWLIVREDIRQEPHVRAFVDSFAAYMVAHRALHGGKAPARADKPDAVSA